MARLPLIDPTHEATSEFAELRPVFEQLRQTRGRVPAMYRLLAHRPAILGAHRAYFNAALDTGVLPRAMKEKIAYKVARLRGSAYSSASHRRYALDHGVTEAELEALDDGAYAGLEAGEAAALTLAEEMVGHGGAVSDACFDALKAHYSPAEIVEIVALVGIMELASSFAAVFGLEPDGTPATGK